MKSVVLVTVKEQANAKVRMAPILSRAERSSLAWTMFCDVAHALGSLSNEVVVVTSSLQATRKAHELGWRVLIETVQISESLSVDNACSRLAAEGVEAVLRIPADIPLVRSQDVAGLLKLPLSAPSTVLVPSWDGTGTNALLRMPPTLFPSRFGPNSLVLHTREALSAGARVTIKDNRQLALDLDDSRDIRLFLKSPSRTLTFELLQQLRIAERLGHDAVRR